METGDKQSASSSAPSLATYGVQRRPSQDTSRSISLRDGWNLLSIPVEAPGRTFEDLLPGCESGFFFDPKTGYRPIREGETIEPGPGFFAKCSTGTVEITGRVPDSSTVDVRAGWNLIGPFADTVGTRSVLSKPSGIVASGFLTYEEGGQYRAAERLLPGRGYWVRAGRSGTLDLTGGLEISPDSAALALVGETQEFTVESAPGDDPEVQWTTTDSAVVSVDPGGLATAGRAGTASVVAQVGGLSDTARVRAQGRGFSAPGSEPIAKHIPRVGFVPPDTSEWVSLKGEGKMSTRKATVIFSDGVTVAQANQLFKDESAKFVGGAPTLETLYLKFPDRSTKEAKKFLQRLNDKSIVETSVLDFGPFKSQQLPPHSARVLWDWSVDTTARHPDRPVGNWGLKRMRVPQMWNLAEEIERTQSKNHSCALIIEATESGFPTVGHQDLPNISVPPGPPLGLEAFDLGNPAHATKVTGIIAARWNNSVGIEGVDPWIDQVHATVTPTWASLAYVMSGQAASGAFRDCGSLVVNNSWGSFAPEVLVTAAAQQLMIHWVNLVFVYELFPETTFYVASAGEDRRCDPDEGNCDTQVGKEATFSGPITKAAHCVGGPFLSVEAMNAGNSRAPFSDVLPADHGECFPLTVVSDPDPKAPPVGVTAPGREVLSTVNTRSYQNFGGTSAAAPYVSGLFSALGEVITLVPDLSDLERFAVLRSVVTKDKYTAVVGGTPADRPDAFAAALGIDQETEKDVIQSHLVNVDDGTEDGNLRVHPFSGEPVTERRKPGKTTTDMADFRAFRDAFVQLQGDSMGVPGKRLDGEETHFLKDLNRDNCVGNLQATAQGEVVNPLADCDTGFSRAPNTRVVYPESLFPRFDFNGNGKIAVRANREVPGADAVAPFKVDPDRICDNLDVNQSGDSFRGCVRDLDVLAAEAVWDSGEGNEAKGSEKVSVEEVEEGMGTCTPPDAGWNTTDLMRDRNDDDVIDYMRSFDLHVRLQADANALSDPSAELLHATTRPGGGSPRGPFPDFDPEGFFLRHGPIEGGSFLKCRKEAVENTITVPVWSGVEDTTKVVYQRREGEENDSDNRYLEWGLTPQLGEDFALRIAPEEGKRASETQEKGTAETSPLLARSTSRGRADSIFSARELIWRDREDPATAGGAYAASSCLPDSGAHEGSKLHRRMTELAEETWIEKTEAEPKSLLRRWLGKENVEVIDPIVRRMSRAPGSITATAVQPGGCTINLGTLLCWDGVLGLPATSDPAERNTPRELEDDKDLRFRSVSVGGRAHVCARESPADSTRTFCWGSNGEGQVGDGTTQTRESPTEVAAPDSVVFTDVRAAGLHACAVTEDGEIFCWGSGERGQLGDGQSTDSAEPTLVTGDQDWQQVTVAGLHSCGLTAGGEAYCWGEGPLGNGDTTSSATPRQVAGDHTFRQLDASETHVCGTTTDEKAFCWGGNGSGQLGDGTTQDRPEPTQVDGLPDARQVASGGFHTCAVTTGDDAYCWGENGSGQLGDGNGGGQELTPVEVTGGIVWGSLSARGALTCGISTGPTGYCWGGPGTQLGDGEDHQGHIHPHDTPRKLAAPTRQCPDGQKAGRLWGAWIEPTAVPEQPPPGGEE